MSRRTCRANSTSCTRLWPALDPAGAVAAGAILQVFYSIRSERLLMEQLDCNILFRWFVGLLMDEPIWAPTVFTKNRDRLLTQEIARSFFRRVREWATPYMSDEHFTVDSTLIDAWASQNSFQPKDGPPEADGRDFRGQARKNDTHASNAPRRSGVTRIDRTRTAWNNRHHKP
jgi:transposase